MTDRRWENLSVSTKPVVVIIALRRLRWLIDTALKSPEVSLMTGGENGADESSTTTSSEDKAQKAVFFECEQKSSGEFTRETTDGAAYPGEEIEGKTDR